jgi:hypothetical protein
MRLYRIAIVLAVSAATGCSVTAQNDAEELRAAEGQRLRSLVKADLDMARRLHADDFKLVNPDGQSLSKDQYLEQIASGELDYVLWEPDVNEVRRYGDAAVLRYQAQAQAVFAGQRTPLRRFWHTDVYEKRNGRWQAVWSQATLIQQ